MKAFTDTLITKEKLLQHLVWHSEQDAFIRGEYSSNFKGVFKGCAVGCSLNSVRIELDDDEVELDKHELYETYFGIPKWLAQLEDTLFEGMTLAKSKKFPVEFINSINVGADLDNIKPDFLIFVLETVLVNIQDIEFKKQKEAVENCIKLWKRKDLYSKEWIDAYSAASSDAYSAAHSAAYSTTRYAAYSAACSDAHSAARSAAHSAARYAAYSTTRYDARYDAYNKFADKLLELIKNCKP